MDCSACNRPIHIKKGYYLLGNNPYCTTCFHQMDHNSDGNRLWQPVFDVAKGTDNLLEAFRAYQERDRNSAIRRY